METNREVQVVMLPTEKAEDAIISFMGRDLFYHKGYLTQSYLAQEGKKSHHLYFLSDEKIEEGDWYVPDYDKTKLLKCTKTIMGLVYAENDHGRQCKKVIATTDESLKIPHENHPDVLPAWSLPKPSQAFIKKYCEVGGIDLVLVEYEEILIPNNENGGMGYTEQYENKPKVNSYNEITIHPIKESWSREEIENLILKIVKDISEGDEELFWHYNGDYKAAKKWLKENLQ